MRWLAATALTAAIHALLALFVVTTGYFGPKGGVSVKRVDPVALRTLPPSAWSQNRQVRPARPDKSSQMAPQAKAPDLPKKPEPEPVPEGKVVDVAPGNGVAPDGDARYLAETNNRVEKETVSRERRLDYRNAMPRPSTTVKPTEPGSGRDEAAEKQVAGNDGRGDDDRKPQEGRQRGAFELPSIQKQEKLALKFEGLDGHFRSVPNDSDEVIGNSDRLRVRPGDLEEGADDEEASAGRSGSNLLNLTPSSAVLDRIMGGPASDISSADDVEEGEATFLNTKQWRHASFFNRVKQNVGLNWHPDVVARRYDPTGEIYLTRDRYTLVSVTLDGQGGLKEILVQVPSGAEFLDREAVAAFRRAQPFPNPPPALQDGHGEIRFTFGFEFSVSRDTGIRLFRSIQ